MQGLRDYQSKSSKSLQSKSSILHDCLRSEDLAKTPCIEESETTALVFLLKERKNEYVFRYIVGFLVLSLKASVESIHTKVPNPPTPQPTRVGCK